MALGRIILWPKWPTGPARGPLQRTRGCRQPACEAWWVILWGVAASQHRRMAWNTSNDFFVLELGMLAVHRHISRKFWLWRGYLVPAPCHAGSPGFMEVQLEGAGLGQEQAQIRKAMQRLESVPRTPLFTLMVRFPRQPAQQPLLPFSAASVVGSADIAWLCMDSAKPGREAQEAGAGSHDALIAITTPTLARTLLGTKEDGSLPPQTPEYLAERAQAVWAAVQPLLTKARGAWAYLMWWCVRASWAAAGCPNGPRAAAGP